MVTTVRLVGLGFDSFSFSFSFFKNLKLKKIKHLKMKEDRDGKLWRWIFLLYFQIKARHAKQKQFRAHGGG